MFVLRAKLFTVVLTSTLNNIRIKKKDEKINLQAHLINLLKRKTVLRMTRAVRDSSF